MSKTLVVFLLFNLTFFTIHPDLNRQYGDFSQHVKNAIFALKAPYQVKKIDSARDRNHPLHINGLEVSYGAIIFEKQKYLAIDVV